MLSHLSAPAEVLMYVCSWWLLAAASLRLPEPRGERRLYFCFYILVHIAFARFDRAGIRISWGR